MKHMISRIALGGLAGLTLFFAPSAWAETGVHRVVATAAEKTGAWANAAVAGDDAYGVIQAEIDASADGETVLLKAGTYAVLDTLDVSTANVTVRGEDGARETTILDGGATGTNRLFNVTGAGARLENLTLRNASCDGNGGGLNLDGADAVVSNVVISGCFSCQYGGGIRVGSGASGLKVCDTTIYDCSSTNQGGAVYLSGANATFTRCTFDTCGTLFRDPTLPTGKTGTDHKGKGGGVYINASGAYFDACTFTNCIAGRNVRYDGGAIYAGTSGSIFTNCLFTGCKAERGGVASGSATRFYRCIFEKCTCGRSGCTPQEWDYPQGHFFYNIGAKLYGCTIRDTVLNDVTANFAAFGSGLLSGCVITNVTRSGGGAKFFEKGTVEDTLVCDCSNLIFMNNGTVNRCIFRDNTVDDPGKWSEATMWFQGGAVVRNVLWTRNTGPLSVYSATAENCTVVDNAGGFRLRGTPTLRNSLVWNTTYHYYDGSRYTGSADCSLRSDDSSLTSNLALLNSVLQGGHSIHTKAQSGSLDFLALDTTDESTRLTDLALASEKGPGFRDVGAANWRLIRRSVLRDGGLRRDWMSGATDLDGQLRCIDRRGKVTADALPDIGAYECELPKPGAAILVK